MKFSLDRKAVFKKFFQLYCQILERVLTKVAVNFVHFAWHGWKLANIPSWFSQIYQKSHGLLQTLTKNYTIAQNFMKFKES